MPLPFVYPNVNGPGRLTELCSFRKSSIPQEQFDKTYHDTMDAMSALPISRRSTLLEQHEDSSIAVLVADWTSAEEKDKFEPGPQYQGLKPNFMTLIDPKNPSFVCHHIVVPGSAQTPICDWYTVSHVKIPVSRHTAVAKIFEAYVMNHTPEDLVFLAVAPSREDPETIVVHSGHWQERNATEGVKSPEHDLVKTQLDRLVESGSKYSAKLKFTRAMA